MTTYNVDNYQVQGGSRWAIGGSLDIVSGGDLDIESGASWKIAGVAVTATAEQLNSIDSVMEVANKSGSPMVAGALVYISGYDTTLDTPIVSLADADDATKKASLVLTDAIADNASGSAEAVATITGLNTDSYSAVGSLVYESATAGESTPTAPTDANDDRRVVGVIKVKSATIGEIYYFPGKAGLEQAAVYLNNITPGTAKASGALIVDASVDIAGINVLGATDIDAGASGTAGSVDVFPATASRGKLTLACTDQTGDTAVTINANAMGQATQINLADPGAVASYMVQSTAAITIAEADVLDGASSVGIVASKAVIADANSKINLPLIGAGAAASASGLLLGVGTSANPVTTATVDAKWLEIRAQTTATSGDNRLAYLRYDINGAAAGGECVRAFTDLTAAASTAHGAHISLQAGDTGYISGLGVGVRAQLYVKDAAVAAGGTYYGAQAEIYSAGSSSSLAAVTKHAVFSIAATGDATGMATVLNALAVDGTSAGDTTKMISSVSLDELPSGTVGIAAIINNTRYYIPAVVVAEWD